METLMESTGWRDLVIHCPRDVALVFGQSGEDLAGFRTWQQDCLDDAAWGDMLWEVEDE